MTIGRTTYYDTDYEIKWVSIMCRDNTLSDADMKCSQRYSYNGGEHIHIDGLLVEKIEPGEMNVWKDVPSALDTETTFSFTQQKMLQPSQDMTAPPVSADAIDTTFAPITLTASIARGEKSAQISGGSAISFGYYKLTENSHSGWENAGVAMTDSWGRTQRDEDADALYICIAPNGSVLYSTTPDGTYTAMERVAIENKRADLKVTYQWKVYDESGFETTLPRGAPSVPAQTSQPYGSQYVYDTEYVEGTRFADYNTGLLYTFQGWDVYTHSPEFTVELPAEGNMALDDGDSNARNNITIPMIADTYINGYWQVTKMPPVSAYIGVKKVIQLEGVILSDDELADSPIAETADLWFRVDPGIDLDDDGFSQADINYPMIQEYGGEYPLPVYQYATPFTFTEHDADISGYTLETTITVTGPHASEYTGGSADPNVDIAVAMSEVYEGEDVKLGTITYTNNYKKNVGTAIEEYPTLILFKRATDTGWWQGNAEFALYSASDCSEESKITAVTTRDEGLATINFKDIMPKADVYYLKETAAPEGYLVDESVYTLTATKAPAGYAATDTEWKITVEEKDGEVSIELNEKTNIWENIWDWIVGGVTGNPDKEEMYTFTPATETDPAVLTVKNVELADLTITKKFAGDVTPPEGAIIEVSVLDSDNNLVEQVQLSAANQWTAKLTDIPADTYTVYEASPSLHGYKWQSAAFAVTGVDAADVTPAASSVEVVVENSEDVNVTITNTYQKWESADFYILKTKDDGVTPLPGAKFNLYDATGTNVTTQHLHIDTTIHTYKDNTTGSGGILHFHNFVVDKGQQAVYTLQETAPANYYENTNVYKIVVTHDDDGYDLTITKTKKTAKR